MARPVIDEPRTKAIGLRLSEADYEKLKEYAAEHNLTITKVVQESLELLYSQANAKF